MNHKNKRVTYNGRKKVRQTLSSADMNNRKSMFSILKREKEIAFEQVMFSSSDMRKNSIPGLYQVQNLLLHREKETKSIVCYVDFVQHSQNKNSVRSFFVNMRDSFRFLNKRRNKELNYVH